MARELPTGTVTFLFTDIEGSTQLAQRLGADYPKVIGAHFEILRDCVAQESGIVVNTTGDGVFAAFSTAAAAVRAAAAIQTAVSQHPWPEGAEIRVRIGVHSGEAHVSNGDYVGIEVHRAARIMAAGHGGQVLVSEATRVLAAVDLQYRPMGRHELRGLDQEETLAQLIVEGLPSDFPPIKTATGAPNNLPLRSSSIVGREDDLGQIIDMLSSSRLVTILGPGGIGKTSLAATVGREILSEFPDGVHFVDLSAIAEPAFVVSSIAEAIGAETRTLAGIALVMGESRRLLIVDNFEHVLGATSDVEALLGQCSGLTVLVTSQTPLRLGGEKRYQLKPLAVEASRHSPGVALFIERATAVEPGFTIDVEEIATLVSMLDGLPLAIELTAARANLLTTSEMIKRLDTIGLVSSGSVTSPDRHRSVAAALEWSYGLLDAELQQTFRWLSVFAGEMSLSAAEEIAAGATAEALSAIAELVDRSLLHKRAGSSARFQMFDAVRQFGRHQLAESGEVDEVRGLFVDYFCDLTTQAHDGLQSDRGEWWRARLEEEMPNVREVLTLLLSAGDIERGLALLGNIWRSLQSHGRLIELQLWLDRFFSSPGPEIHSEGRIKGLMARAALGYWVGDTEGAISDYRSALEAARALDDVPLSAEALYGLGTSLVIANRLTEAEPLLEEAESLYEDLGDAGGLADIVAGKAFMTIRSEGLVGLGPTMERAAELYEKAGRRVQATQCVIALSAVAIAEERLDDAVVHAESAMRRSRELNDVFMQTWVLEYFARIAFDAGDYQKSALYAGSAHDSRARIGGGWSPQSVGLDNADELLVDRFGKEEAARMMQAGLDVSFESILAELGDADATSFAWSK